MFKKHLILLGIIISLVLLVIATLNYPGGSQADKNAIGYDWKNNFISNLFTDKAVNGAKNLGRYWAAAGMIFFSASFALFFVEFSKKIPQKGAAKIVKYTGAGGMIFTALIATPLHDIMITIASTLFLLGMFYITVFVIKSKLTVLKFLCILCLLVFYGSLYLFGVGDFRWFLPVMQKITFSVTIIVIIGLSYFTSKEDFEHIKPKK